jgi:hypothetical protein
MPTLPKAVICDIDGTLARMVNRGPYDTSKYLDDELVSIVHWAFARLSQGATRIICSGRSEDFREVTQQWLASHGITFDCLLMRPAKDNRSDAVVKREMYEREIAGKYDVRLVLDDRSRVVNMWRELGLTCFQVAPGDF